MKLLFALLRLVLALVLGLIGLIFASLVMVLILSLVLVGVLWAWLQGRRARPGAQVWMRGSWTFRTGPQPAPPDGVDVRAHEVAATKTPATLQEPQRLLKNTPEDRAG